MSVVTGSDLEAEVGSCGGLRKHLTQDWECLSPPVTTCLATAASKSLSKLSSSQQRGACVCSIPIFEDESRNTGNTTAHGRGTGLKMESKRWDQLSVGEKGMDEVVSCHLMCM